MRVIDIKIKYQYDDELVNQNFNVAKVAFEEYTFFKMFYITVKKMTVKNSGHLIYKEIKLYVTRHRYIEELDNEEKDIL